MKKLWDFLDGINFLVSFYPSRIGSIASGHEEFNYFLRWCFECQHFWLRKQGLAGWLAAGNEGGGCLRQKPLSAGTVMAGTEVWERLEGQRKKTYTGLASHPSSSLLMPPRSQARGDIKTTQFCSSLFLSWGCARMEGKQG